MENEGQMRALRLRIETTFKQWTEKTEARASDNKQSKAQAKDASGIAKSPSAAAPAAAAAATGTHQQKIQQVASASGWTPKQPQSPAAAPGVSAPASAAADAGAETPGAAAGLCGCFGVQPLAEATCWIFC